MEEALMNNSYTISAATYHPTVSGTASGEWAYVSPNVYYPNFKEGEVKDMRGLFSVYVVDPEEGDIVYQGVVVAENAKKAEFKVLSAAMRISEDKYEVDDLDIICNRLGDVREKRKIQRVQVVDGD